MGCSDEHALGTLTTTRAHALSAEEAKGKSGHEAWLDAMGTLADMALPEKGEPTLHTEATSPEPITPRTPPVGCSSYFYPERGQAICLDAQLRSFIVFKGEEVEGSTSIAPDFFTLPVPKEESAAAFLDAFLEATPEAAWGSLAFGPDDLHFAWLDPSVSVSGDPGPLSGALPLGEVGLGWSRYWTGERNAMAALELANTAVEAGAHFAVPGYHAIGAPTAVPNVPNDPFWRRQWHLYNTRQRVPGYGRGRRNLDVRAPFAWSTTTGDSALITVLLDDGVQRSHPDLSLGPGFDATIAPSPNPGEPDNLLVEHHGTQVAGAAFALRDNALHVAGLAKVDLRSARVAINLGGGSSYITDAALVDALAWADAIKAEVSVTGVSLPMLPCAPQPSCAWPTLGAMYRETTEGGMLHFAGSGNIASTSQSFPAAHPSVLGISAHTNRGQLASFSSSGPGLAFSAPGAGILTTDITGTLGSSTGDLTWASGTSLAAGIAAGVASLVRSARPELNAEQTFRAMLISAAEAGEEGHDEAFGFGLVDADAAIKAAKSEPALHVIDGYLNAQLPTSPGGLPIGVNTPVLSAGDLNGDGAEDYVVTVASLSGQGSVQAYSGADHSVLWSQVGDLTFGYTLGGGGDVDGDGVNDVVVTTSLDAIPAGPLCSSSVSLLSGSDGALLNRITHPDCTVAFGWSTLLADLDADGRAELILSAPLKDPWYGPGVSSGHVFIFQDPANPLTSVDDAEHLLPGAATQDALFGYALTSLGEFDQTPGEDFAVGAPGYQDGRGRVIVYAGYISMFVPSFLGLHLLDGDTPNDLFGRSISGAQDLDQDGYDDLLIGSPGHNNTAGAAFVYSGGPEVSLIWSALGLSSDERLGWSVAMSGDLNIDGFPDLVVSALRDGGVSSGAPTQAGSLSVYDGRSGELELRHYGESFGAQLGFHLSAHGDIDADGLPELMVATLPMYSSGAGAQLTFLSGRFVFVNGQSCRLCEASGLLSLLP